MLGTLIPGSFLSAVGLRTLPARELEERGFFRSTRRSKLSLRAPCGTCMPGLLQVAVWWEAGRAQPRWAGFAFHCESRQKTREGAETEVALRGPVPLGAEALSVPAWTPNEGRQPCLTVPQSLRLRSGQSTAVRGPVRGDRDGGCRPWGPLSRLVPEGSCGLRSPLHHDAHSAASLPTTSALKRAVL